MQSNIALILHAVGEYELSLRFAECALNVTSSSHGPRSLKAAVARHLLARTLSCLGDFRAALQHEKETYSIYKQLVSRLYIDMYVLNVTSSFALTIFVEYLGQKSSPP